MVICGTRPLLQLSALKRHFGGVRAIDDVSLAVPQGTIVGLIGPNGAGKTTLVNLITGYVRADSGAVRLDDLELVGLPPHRIASMGIARTFQTLRLYREHSAVDNILIGMHSRFRHDTLRQMLPLPALRRRRSMARDEAYSLLRTVGLDPKAVAPHLAARLSYGDQRRVEIARALALKPRLLILDEPAAGMNAVEKGRIRELIEQLNADGITILLIDHDMRLVMGVCRQLIVLNFGCKIAEGSPKAVAADPQVVTAYLGTHAETDGRSYAPVVKAVAKDTGRPHLSTGTDTPMLDVSGLSVAYGSVMAVRDVSFRVGHGEAVALLGSNGAGKSTILKTLSGTVRARSGCALFHGMDLCRTAPHRIVRTGLVQVPEGREILQRLTVYENLALGGWSRQGSSDMSSDIQEVMRRFPILGQRAELPAGQLSGGEQQLLAIARALLARPRLLLLDEPSLGLAPKMVDQVFEVIESIHASGTSVLLVEQNALRALEIADRAYVLETGHIVLSGLASSLMENPAVTSAFLGV